MDSHQIEIGELLKEARDKKKLTQAQVATGAGVNVNYYARIERGEENPTIEILRKLAKALNVKSSEILPF